MHSLQRYGYCFVSLVMLTFLLAARVPCDGAFPVCGRCSSLSQTCSLSIPDIDDKTDHESFHFGPPPSHRSKANTPDRDAFTHYELEPSESDELTEFRTSASSDVTTKTPDRNTTGSFFNSYEDGASERLPPSPLQESDSMEYFSEVAMKPGTSLSSGLLIRSPDGQPADIFFQPPPRVRGPLPPSQR